MGYEQEARDRGWRNCYMVMRHGESFANLRGIIASSIEADTQHEAGLTERGKRQVQAAAETSGLGADVLLICSDFIRARQSADILAGVLGCGTTTIDPRLRERHFGKFDGTGVENYARVWAADSRGELTASVESVESVRSRVLSLLAEIEALHSGRAVILVAHGDTLQILETVFAGIPPREHRSLQPLLNAELRQLNSCRSFRHQSNSEGRLRPQDDPDEQIRQEH
ncbi:histidine phosphatase family protein [Arthrobacter burdickii]|uniref:Histidine phosphatase family protein n=1 Tax=Arthrobacter burdickii TaxID=3035920 RepID=A0ABT8JY98_9MICC|nr:histidine phosphatase family protein [Arthrobacter burdickii]MDN4610140.1 histidine phosphatase family protein [Arthrobacter burdickii]